MTKEQLELLLSLYKKAVSKNLKPNDFLDILQDVNLKLDKSFVEFGKKDMNLGEYLNELSENTTWVS